MKLDRRQTGCTTTISGLGVLVVLLCLYTADVSAQPVGSTPAELKKLSIEELLNVEVMSVSRRGQKITEAPSAIQVITQEDMRSAGVTSITEALRLANNLQVAQVNASQWAISARGFNNVLANKLLVLIDGRVVYTPLYAGVFWDVQNLVLDDVQQIEVISGPGGTLWGANAVNGVINIITRKAQDTQGLFVEAAAGTELRALGSLRYGGKLSDNLYYRVYGTAFKRGNTIFTDSTEAADDWTMAQSGIRLDWQPDSANAVFATANFYDGRPDPDGGQPVQAKGHNVLARWNRTTSERAGLQMQLYYDHTLRDFRNGFLERLQTYDLDGHHRFAVTRRHSLVYGVGVRMLKHDVHNLELFAFLPESTWLHLFSAFIQDEVDILHNLQFTAGIKLGHNNYTGIQYQPSLRLNWQVNTNHRLWAAVSRAVRNPSRIDRDFYLYLTPDLHYIEGGDFQSENVIAYELGWRSQMFTSMSISLSTYYNRYDDLRSTEPGPPPLSIPLYFANGVAGESYGAELFVQEEFTSWWRLRGGYTLLGRDLRLKTGSSDLNNASEGNDPSHQVLVQSIMNFQRRYEVGIVFRHVGKLDEPVVEAYADLDIRVSWTINKMLELNVVGQHLLNKAHTEFIPSSPAPKDIERGVYFKIVGRL
jgi:iron complex outermembrane receptor protein